MKVYWGDCWWKWEKAPAREHGMENPGENEAETSEPLCMLTRTNLIPEYYREKGSHRKDSAQNSAGRRVKVEDGAIPSG